LGWRSHLARRLVKKGLFQQAVRSRPFVVDG
jgi:hypothetical protein